MHGKTNVLTALNHQETPTVPIDFGATPVTGIHALAIENLRNFFHLKRQPIKINEPYQMLGEIDDDLAEILGIDTIGISPRKTMFGFPNEKWKEFNTPWGQTVLVPEKFNVTRTPEGDILMYPEGDTSARPCAKMPAKGYFFDAIYRQLPIDEEHLDPEDNLQEYTEITENELNYFEREVNRCAATDKVIVANFGGTALGDIALVPALHLKDPKGIRDVTEWYISTLTRQDYIHQIFKKQTDIALKNLEKIFSRVENKVNVLYICGTDFGTQDSQFCSEDTFLLLYAPYYRKINNWIHKNTSWKTFKHSCGSVEPFIKHFIDVGFDILNPVQVSAAGMEPVKLKENYGKDIVFWGGGVDTQYTLPFGTEKEVEEQVIKHCEIFSRNGGFVFNTVHNIQANVPVRNIVAMLRGIRRFNGENTDF